MKLILNADETVFAIHSDDQVVAHLYPGMTEQVVPDDTVLDLDDGTGEQRVSTTQPADWARRKALASNAQIRNRQQDLLLRILADDKRVDMSFPSLEDRHALTTEITRLEGHVIIIPTREPGPSGGAS